MKETFDDIVTDIAERNASAAAFLRMILAVSCAWDGLIDRDRPVSDDEINQAFCCALIDLPRNGFYNDHFHLLHPLVINAMTNWRIATQIEREQDADGYDISFIIRSSYVDLFAMCGFILGGNELALETGLRARRYVHDEGRQGYEEALLTERETREVGHGMRQE